VIRDFCHTSCDFANFRREPSKLAELLVSDHVELLSAAVRGEHAKSGYTNGRPARSRCLAGLVHKRRAQCPTFELCVPSRDCCALAYDAITTVQQHAFLDAESTRLHGYQGIGREEESSSTLDYPRPAHSPSSFAGYNTIRPIWTNGGPFLERSSLQALSASLRMCLD